MRRKLTTLLLGSILALGALTACGETATEDGTGTDTDTITSPAASDALLESPMASDAMMMSPEASPSE